MLDRAKPLPWEWVGVRRYGLLILLVDFLLPLFLGRQQGLFSLFLFPFVFTSLITHVSFSVIENVGSVRRHSTGPNDDTR